MNIKDAVNIDPERMGGAPCFTCTRVPISHLFEFIESGETIDEFLRQFPSVTREQATAALELSKEPSSPIMKLLLDECVVYDLKRDLADCTCENRLIQKLVHVVVSGCVELLG